MNDISDHLGFDFGKWFGASVEVAARTGAGFKVEPIDVKVSIDVDARTDYTEVAFGAPRFRPKAELKVIDKL